MKKSDRRAANRQRDNQSTVAADHVEAVNEETGQTFIVRGDEVHGMAVELAGMVRVNVEGSACIARINRTSDSLQ